MQKTIMREKIYCPVLYSVFEYDEKHWFHSEYTSHYNVRHFHADCYKPLLPFVKVDSELFNILCDNKIHFEYHPTWSFSRFCMGWMQSKNPKLFSQIYMLVHEALKDFPVKAVISHGNIDVKIKPLLVNGNIEDEINSSLKWAEAVNVNFDSKKIIDLCESEKEHPNPISSPLKVNDKVINKGIVVTKWTNKEVAEESFKRIQQRITEEFGNTLFMEQSKKKDGGYWTLIITLPEYIEKHKN